MIIYYLWSGEIFVTLLTITRYMFVAQISLISPAQLTTTSSLSYVGFQTMAWLQNPDKFQAIFLGTADNNVSIDIGSAKIVGSKQVELLGAS